MEELDPGYETTVYNNPPLPAIPRLETVDVPRSIFAGQALPLGGPGYVTPTFEASRAAAAARAAMLERGRLEAADYLSRESPEVRAQTMIRTNQRTGVSHLVARPQPVEMDPLVQQLALQQAEVNSKINSLLPVLTMKQRLLIKRRLETITHYRKGKRAGDVKSPTTDQLHKVLFRALELHASRRAAQLGAQARRAKRERHALQQKGRPVDLPDGTTVGNNKRYLKKIASNSVRKVGIQQAQNEAKAIRLTYTQANKERRVAIARAHGRKIQPKDLLPAKN